MAATARRLFRGARRVLKRTFPRTFRRVSGIRGVTNRQVALVAKRVLGESRRLEERILNEFEEKYDSVRDKEKWGQQFQQRILEEPAVLVRDRVFDFARFAAIKSVLDQYGIRAGRDQILNAEHEMLERIFDLHEKNQPLVFSNDRRMQELQRRIGEVVGPREAAAFSKEVFRRCNIVLDSVRSEIDRLEDAEAARIRKKQPKKR